MQWKKKTPDEHRNEMIEKNKEIETGMPFDDFYKWFRDDPVAVLRAAADAEMSIAQYSNHVSNETLLEQKRSVLARIREEEQLYARSSRVSKSSHVTAFLDEPHKVALMQDILFGAYYGERTQITIEASAPVASPLLPFSNSMPAPVASGLKLNPGELIAYSHEVGTDNYQPFKWDYSRDNDDKNLKRHNVAPGAIIPATTLGQKRGTIQMEKWGNRFILPYETLTGANMTIDKLANMIRLEGLTEESRMFAELIDVFENGDGTDGSPAEVVDQDAVGGTAPTATTEPEFLPLLNAIDEVLDHPFYVTHVILTRHAQREFRKQVSALEGRLAFQQLTMTGLSPNFENMEEYSMEVRYGRAPVGSLTEGKTILIDSRAAMEYVSRAGMAVRQQADSIANESREVVISDTYLWSKLAFEACKVLRWRTA